MEDGHPRDTAEDRREFRRFEITAYVDFTGSEVLLYHRIENISLGGICIQSTNVEPIGTIVDLVINLPDLETSLAMQGEVVWCNREEPMDMGIRYIDPEPEQRDVLRQFIQAQRERREISQKG